MSFKQLKLVLKVGQLLAITPGYKETENQTFLRKLYAFFMIGLITIGVSVSGVYRYRYYVNFIQMKAVIQILLDSALYILNIYAVLMAVCKRTQWFKLIKNLKKTQNVTNEKSHLWAFIASNFFYWGMEVHMTYLFTKIMDVEFYKQFAIEYLQMYSQFLIYFLLHVLLKMIISRYRSITNILNDQLGLIRKLERRQLRPRYPMTCLRKLKYDICLLKETVDIFNNIFGWPILFSIIFTSLQVLIYLQVIFTRGFKTVETVVYSFSIIFWHSAWTFIDIFLCDLVTYEVEKIFSVTYSLEKYFICENKKGSEELQKFIDVLKDNIPSFSAARFFAINRTTIFGIFNAIITFLIVLIQFETNQGSGGIHSIFDCHLYCPCNETQHE
ncbi:gustatory receptor [Asbolus verrucosus]|uniref:Gustatory receptor n=1 Tax=Asbolus verrucosus TaxID=1661398 RepID=A0A482WA07_ASBVE|nr:gustatory receptor [Asbolus verrucosus]